MFIQKDLRKIPRILADAAPLDNADKDNGEEPETKRMKRNVLTELRLSRRNSEFNGSLKILCQPQNAPSLQHLVSLSLYDCQIQSLEGIGMLASSEIEKNSGKCNVVCCSPMLRELNVGRNPITFLPDELALLPLKELWMDDCQLTGPLPDCITRMKDLEILRVSNNKITHIPSSIQKLRELRTLCLDRNEIETVPEELSRLHYLETLLLRNNKIQTLPEGVPGVDMSNLMLLHLSSNQLESLPSSLVECTSLTYLYLHSNCLTFVPFGLANTLIHLKRLTLSHNRITSLAPDFVERFGEATTSAGAEAKCDLDPTCCVTLACNPILMNENAMYNVE